jgi:hypothetical protein
MRMIVLGFAIVAGMKVYTQDRLYRAAMGEALVQAYRERAQQVCIKELARSSRSIPPAGTWAAGSATAEVVIGNPNASVAIWDFDNPLWEVRFHHPHLILSGPGSPGVTCAYDLKVGFASLSGR